MHRIILILGVFVLICLLVEQRGGVFAAEDREEVGIALLEEVGQKKVQDITEGDCEGILEYFELKPPMTKETAPFYTVLGFCNYRLGYNQRAIDVLENITAFDPEDVKSLALLGISYKAVHEMDKSRQAFEAFIQASKKSAKTIEEANNLWVIEQILR